MHVSPLSPELVYYISRSTAVVLTGTMDGDPTQCMMIECKHSSLMHNYNIGQLLQCSSALWIIEVTYCACHNMACSFRLLCKCSLACWCYSYYYIAWIEQSSQALCRIKLYELSRVHVSPLSPELIYYTLQ